MTPTLYTVYCDAADFDAATMTCAAPFYGPVPGGLLPKLSASEGFALAVVIVGAWAVGFYIKSARRAASN